VKCSHSGCPKVCHEPVSSFVFVHAFLCNR
jgi:hypothetical protein